MFKKILFVFVLGLMFVPIVSFATEQKKAYYFFSPTCPHCQNVDDFFQEEKIYQKYKIKKLDIHEKENQELLGDFFVDFGIKKGGIPTVVFDERILIGDQNIISNFESEIKEVDADTFPIPGSSKKEKELKLPVLIGAALVDAINPCAFAVLILLVATVIGAKGKKKGLYSGLLFALAVFASYILIGFGIYSVISFFNLPKIISIIVGVLAVLIGLANLKDAFWYGKGFVMEVPLSWRPKMKSIIQKVVSPWGAFGTGFIVSLFLLPCTSGPYVVILGMIAQNPLSLKAISYLILYNFIFVLPMLLITIGMYYGLRAGILEKWRQNHLKFLHGIAGVIMLVIGIYLIYNWV